MKSYKTSFDISNELLLQRFGSGIKLIRPPSDKKLSCRSSCLEKFAIGNIFNLPFNVYFLDLKGANQKVNIVMAETMGFDSIKSSLGKTIFDIADKSNAQRIRNNDLNLLKSNKIQITEEDAFLNTSAGFQQSLTIKYNCHDESNKVIGIFGCSIMLGKHKISDSLQKLFELGLLDQYEPIQNQISKLECNTVYFSQREKQCLEHLIRGRSAKTIAEKLHLSRRTIEHYINSLKTKLNVTSKAEILEKYFKYFFPES